MLSQSCSMCAAPGAGTLRGEMLNESVHGAGSVERCQSEQADSGSWKEEAGTCGARFC